MRRKWRAGIFCLLALNAAFTHFAQFLLPSGETGRRVSPPLTQTPLQTPSHNALEVTSLPFHQTLAEAGNGAQVLPGPAGGHHALLASIGDVCVWRAKSVRGSAVPTSLTISESGSLNIHRTGTQFPIGLETQDTRCKERASNCVHVQRKSQNIALTAAAFCLL